MGGGVVRGGVVRRARWNVEDISEGAQTKLCNHGACNRVLCTSKKPTFDRTILVSARAQCATQSKIMMKTYLVHGFYTATEKRDDFERSPQRQGWVSRHRLCTVAFATRISRLVRAPAARNCAATSA